MYKFNPGVCLHLHDLRGGGPERSYRALLNSRYCAKVVLR